MIDRFELNSEFAFVVAIGTVGGDPSRRGTVVAIGTVGGLGLLVRCIYIYASLHACLHR